MTLPGDSRHSVPSHDGSLTQRLVHDDERTGTAIDVIQRHFLRGHNQVNSSSEKN
jgi:hypothetical protein